MNVLSDRFDAAFLLAAELHRQQVRKGSGAPYLSHLIAVCALVLEHGGDEDQAIAALLHDAVEDQGGAPTLARIRSRFGDRVADLVAACTDTDVIPKPPWQARKEAYITHLRTDVPADALLISLADKVHNARTIATDYATLGDKVFDLFTGAQHGTCWYYRALVSAYQTRGLSAHPLLHELVSAIDRWAVKPVA